MANITLRSGKGSPLTHDEVDDNFTNLNNEIQNATEVDSRWDTKYATKNLVEFNNGASSGEDQPDKGQVLTATEYVLLVFGSAIDSDTMYFLT